MTHRQSHQIVPKSVVDRIKTRMDAVLRTEMMKMLNFAL